MSRRQEERASFRRAWTAGLAVSVAAHALLLALGAVGVPLWPDDESAAEEREERGERWEERSLQVVSVRAAGADAASASDAAAPSEASARSVAASGGEAGAVPAVRRPETASLDVEPARVPTVAVTMPAEVREEERLSATELAGMFPGRDRMPRPTSRAAREASGPARDVGDRFEGISRGGTRSAGPRGGGCVVNPGSLINRRLPRGLPFGGS